MSEMLAEGMESERALAIATYLGSAWTGSLTTTLSSPAGMPLARNRDTLRQASDRNGMGPY